MAKELIDSNQFVKNIQEVLLVSLEPLGQLVLAFLEMFMGRDHLQRTMQKWNVVVK